MLLLVNYIVCSHTTDIVLGVHQDSVCALKTKNQIFSQERYLNLLSKLFDVCERIESRYKTDSRNIINCC